MTATPLVLHVWPGRWDLPSIDAGCLEAILYAQLSFPGGYSLVETADPDLSPSGQLPFLAHGHLNVSPLPSIISYLSNLNPVFLTSTDAEDLFQEGTSKPDLDAGLSTLHLAQRAAWRAYIEAQLGDLVTHSFFVLDPNFQKFTHGLLASMLPVPQCYYVPRRIRETYRPRLEAVGLWQVASEPEEPEKHEVGKRQTGDDKEKKIRRAFGQAKLVEKARVVFDILSKLLNEQSFIFDDRPTSIDLVLASRILLLTRAPLPNSILRDLLHTSYPSLVSHASRIYALAFPDATDASNPPPPILSYPPRSPFSLLKRSTMRIVKGVATSPEESEEEKRFRRYRWGWVALAVAGAVGYITMYGLRIYVVVQENRSQEAEEDEEPTEEEEELADEVEEE